MRWLSKERTETFEAQVFDQERADRLSSIGILLMFSYIKLPQTSSRRWVIKKNQNDYSPDAGADKVLDVLMRNRELCNAPQRNEGAEKPAVCKETIVDKLKRTTFTIRQK